MVLSIFKKSYKKKIHFACDMINKHLKKHEKNNIKDQLSYGTKVHCKHFPLNLYIKSVNEDETATCITDLELDEFSPSYTFELNEIELGWKSDY